MGQSDLESDLLRGNTPTLVLAVLSEGGTHGYAIAKRINALTDDSLAMRQGTLYPVLNALERDGLVTSLWEHPEGERPRKVFTITDAGAADLARRTVVWRRFATGVNQILGIKLNANRVSA
jgi:PadR family transcriptional regulator, regulatory protein PadR